MLDIIDIVKNVMPYFLLQMYVEMLGHNLLYSSLAVTVEAAGNT